MLFNIGHIYLSIGFFCQKHPPVVFTYRTVDRRWAGICLGQDNNFFVKFQALRSPPLRNGGQANYPSATRTCPEFSRRRSSPQYLMTEISMTDDQLGLEALRFGALPRAARHILNKKKERTL